MKRTKWAVILIVMSGLLPLHLRAQTRPNFSGVWRLEAAASRMIGGDVARDSNAEHEMHWVIEHHEPNISVAVQVRDSHGSHEWSFKCTTDRRVCVNELPDLKEVRRISATWQDDVLLMKQTAQTPHGSFEAEDRLYLTDAGERLIFERKLEDQRGQRSVRQVFRKSASASARDSFVGVFEGRTPCGELFVEFTGYAGPGCEKIKWRLSLYRDAKRAPSTYVFDGTRVTRTGKWLVERGTAAQPNAVVYRLLTDLPVKSIALLRADDNVLLLLDGAGRLMVGDASWSYTLSRTR